MSTKKETIEEKLYYRESRVLRQTIIIVEKKIGAEEGREKNMEKDRHPRCAFAQCSS